MPHAHEAQVGLFCFVIACGDKRAMDRLHLRGLRGAEEEFLLGATIANLVMLARPTQRSARSRRTSWESPRVDHMAKISRGRFEQSYYATIF